jgi:hypothetical protein
MCRGLIFLEDVPKDRTQTQMSMEAMERILPGSPLKSGIRKSVRTLCGFIYVNLPLAVALA